jgi:hypothetical protein
MGASIPPIHAYLSRIAGIGICVSIRYGRKLCRRTRANHSLVIVIRQMLVSENKRLDREEKEMSVAKRLRIEEAARLEGLTFEEALERNKGFRYLY